MANKLPSPSVIWEEQRHIFIPIGPHRWQHYIRDFNKGMKGAERLVEGKSYTWVEVEEWIVDHSPPPIQREEVEAVLAFNPEVNDSGLIDGII